MTEQELLAALIRGIEVEEKLHSAEVLAAWLMWTWIVTVVGCFGSATVLHFKAKKRRAA